MNTRSPFYIFAFDVLYLLEHYRSRLYPYL